MLKDVLFLFFLIAQQLRHFLTETSVAESETPKHCVFVNPLVLGFVAKLLSFSGILP